MDRQLNVPIMDRIRLIGYGLIAGLVIGAILGWLFHAWVGFIIRMFVFAAGAALILGAIYFWRRVTSKPVVSSQPTVRDADWIEIDSSTRTRR